jgi:hypothetical protein
MTEYINNLIKDDIPFIYVKFGDGEYNASIGVNGHNCDNDLYTYKLQKGLKESINYYSLVNNAFCGKWYNIKISNYFDSIVSGKINWLDYECFIINNLIVENKSKLELYKSIKNSKRKKLIISNELLIKSINLLNIDKHIVVPYRNWFDNMFDDIYEQIIKYYNDDLNVFIITCAGMGSKVLIMELHKKFPNGIFIDIGSGLDYLCTKKSSRGNKYDYESLENYFKEILSNDWYDSKYNYIYEKAKTNIGIHL